MVLASCNRELCHHRASRFNGLRAGIPNDKYGRRTALRRPPSSAFYGQFAEEIRIRLRAYTESRPRAAGDVRDPSLPGRIHPLGEAALSLSRWPAPTELPARHPRLGHRRTRHMAGTVIGPFRISFYLLKSPRLDTLRPLDRMGIRHGERPPRKLAMQRLLARYRRCKCLSSQLSQKSTQRGECQVIWSLYAIGLFLLPRQFRQEAASRRAKEGEGLNDDVPLI